MKIQVNKYQIYCSLNSKELLIDKQPILLLHGFAGSTRDWENIIPGIDKNFCPLAIDLVGHGQSSSPHEQKHYTQKSLVFQIEKTLDFYSINQAILCGYSMGGRAALSFYNANPKRVKGLILESTNPGIENSKAKSERIKNDNKLIEMIKSYDMKDFIDYWYSLPIFSSLKNIGVEKYNLLLKQRYSNSVAGLSNSLSGFGTAAMTNMWNLLSSVNIPVKLVAGSLDEKYCKIMERMNEEVKQSELSIIKDAGHNIHLEKPAEFVSLFNNFLGNYFLK